MVNIRFDDGLIEGHPYRHGEDVRAEIEERVPAVADDTDRLDHESGACPTDRNPVLVTAFHG
jgi:hypothetical protein